LSLVRQSCWVLSDVAAQRRRVVTGDHPVDRQLGLAFPTADAALRAWPELSVDRGLDPGLRQEVLQDANVCPAHSLAQVPSSECDAASIRRAYRQREYS